MIALISAAVSFSSLLQLTRRPNSLARSTEAGDYPDKQMCSLCISAEDRSILISGLAQVSLHWPVLPSGPTTSLPFSLASLLPHLHGADPRL